MFIFLDTETTGNGPDDRLCQIAFKPENGKTVSGLFHPGRPISIRHITTAVFMFLIPLSLITFANAEAQAYKVIRVYDGDTITILNAGQKQSIRLVGIDTPEKSRKKHEPGQPYSHKATKFLAGLVLGKKVSIESYSTDCYGRVLGVVYPGQINVNLEMVKNGYAEVYRGRPAKGFDWV